MNGRIVLALIVCLLATADAASGSGSFDARSAPRALPVNIAVDAALQDVVAGMLEQSPAFRVQVQALGRIRPLRVRITLNEQGPHSVATRAQCRLLRYQYGGLVAEVQLHSRAEAPELIAHELEHVAEFAEGANYRALSLHQPGAVWVTSAGHFETRRAIDAGERVAREVCRLR